MTVTSTERFKAHLIWARRELRLQIKDKTPLSELNDTSLYTLLDISCQSLKINGRKVNTTLEIFSFIFHVCILENQVRIKRV